MNALRGLLRVGNLDMLRYVHPCGVFRKSDKFGCEPYVFGTWLRLCQVLGERVRVKGKFDRAAVPSLIADLKRVMRQPGLCMEDLKSTLAKHGIIFVLVPHCAGVPVQGYTSLREDGAYQIAMTVREASADIFWFSLFHEIGHIHNGDLEKARRYGEACDNEQSVEDYADVFAKNTLLDPASYGNFVNAKNFTPQAIKAFTASQDVLPEIVVGRLEHGRYVSHSRYARSKRKYKLTAAMVA